MKVLLIKPPYTRIRKMGQAPYFPLGLGYVAAVLEKNGFDVRIYHAENPRLPDENAMVDEEAIFHQRSRAQKLYHETINNDRHPVWEEVRTTVKNFKPDIVGISVLTVEVPSALKLSRICKEFNPDVPVVWGGVHPTFLPDEVLKYGPVDIVVKGEGEETFLALCKSLEDGGRDYGSVKGLAYKKDGEIRHTPMRPLIEDLDSIPFPATHLILYPESFNYKSMGSMIASRGCPWRCSFCSSRLFWEKKLRLRSPENIIAEIKEIKTRHNTNYIMFWDDSFSVSRKVVLGYCKGLVESGLNIRWRTATRANLVDDEVLGWMKKAGCVKLEIGVETGSPRMQRIIRKDVTNEMVKNAFSRIQANGIATGAFFMAGFPEEKMDDIEETFKLMHELDIEEIAYNIFDPMPGSELLEQCVKLGLVKKNADWSRFSFWPDSHFMKYVTPEEFKTKAVEIGRWVYNRNNRLPVKFRRVKSLVWFYIFNDPATLVRKVVDHIRRRMRSATLSAGKRDDMGSVKK